VAITGGVITIVFSLVGLFGAAKENYCLTMTFAILMTIVTIFSIYSSIQAGGVGWAGFAINLIAAAMAYNFAYQLKSEKQPGANQVYLS
jgi:hypothetical protein